MRGAGSGLVGSGSTACGAAGRMCDVDAMHAAIDQMSTRQQVASK